MNDFQKSIVSENELKRLIGTYIIAKLKTGRAISGILVLSNDSTFTIKLGTKNIPLELEALAKVTAL